MFRTFAAVMFLSTLVGCETRADRDKLLRSEIVGRWEIQTDKYVGQISFAEDGSLSMSVNWRGLLLRLAPGIAGEYTGTWSISNAILTMQLDGKQKQSGDEFRKMLDALPPGHDEDKKMFGGTTCKLGNLHLWGYDDLGAWRQGWSDSVRGSASRPVSILAYRIAREDVSELDKHQLFWILMHLGPIRGSLCCQGIPSVFYGTPSGGFLATGVKAECFLFNRGEDAALRRIICRMRRSHSKKQFALFASALVMAS